MTIVDDDVAGKMDAKNLEAAKVSGSSGLGNESSYDHTVRHLDNLGDSRITDTAQMAENLCENFGDKANLATIACKMAPYALQAELGLELPEGANPTSYQMLNYIAEHDLTPEQQAKFDQFLEKNFDGSRFRTENFPDWSKPAQVQETPGAGKEPEVKENGDTKVNVNVNGQDGQTVKVNSDKIPQEVGQDYNINVNVKVSQDGMPVEQILDMNPQPHYQNVQYQGMTPQDVYALERGYVPAPEFARGLDVDGNFNGTFKGYHPMTYINPDTGRVLYLPRDMVTDRDAIADLSISNAKACMRVDGHMYNNRNGSYYGGVRHMYPGGLGYGGSEIAYEASRETKFWNTLNKINAISQTVGDVAHDASRVSRDISRVVHDIQSWKR